MSSPVDDEAVETNETRPTPAPAVVPLLPERLAFQIVEGDIENHFLREGPLAAHVLVTRGVAPRVLVVFPAGNGGAGLWFEESEAPAHLSVDGHVTPVDLGGLSGVALVARSLLRTLTVSAAVLGSVRALRARAHGREAPAEMAFESSLAPDGSSVALRRTTANGRRIELTVEPLDGAAARFDVAGRLVLEAAGPPL